MNNTAHHPALDKHLTAQVHKYLAMPGTFGMVTGRDRMRELDITFFGPAWDFRSLDEAKHHQISKGNDILSEFLKARNRTQEAVALLEANPGMSAREASRRCGVDVMAVLRALRISDKPRCPHCGSLIRHS